MQKCSNKIIFILAAAFLATGCAGNLDVKDKLLVKYGKIKQPIAERIFILELNKSLMKTYIAKVL